MLTFSWLWILLLLPLPLLIKKSQSAKVQTGHLHLPGLITSKVEQAHFNQTRPQISLWLVWALLLCALARPQWLGDPIELPSQGRDLMLAVDLSGSMQIEDMQLNNQKVDRFRLIQHVLGQFIERRQGDRLGLILFADHAYLQAPLTLDRRSVAQYLKEAQIGLVGKQTAIGEAIGLGVKRFDKVEDSNRILILLTDGSNNAGSISPEQATEIAKQRGVTIYTIGVGSDVLERRTLFGKERVNPSVDLNEQQLNQIANTTGGRYFRARNTEELSQIYQEIDKLEPISREQISYRPKSELFFWPLILAVLLSVIATVKHSQLLSRRKAKPKTTAQMKKGRTQ